ncbi:MAG TPA: thioredoxin-like domain-containing protein, partial [Gemmataceae bacterium]|nr:thioredoxin-like domain-containing protein [Gemmataceae bacterium]
MSTPYSGCCPLARWARLGMFGLGFAVLVGAVAFVIVKAAHTPAESAHPAPAAATATGGKAPELDGGTAWLNSAGPIKLADLKGRIVLLDFWTLCCINCIHTLPDLAKLEAKYPGILVVIGVHTPKFPNEKETESIRKAILRYEIAHPVINDAEGIIWRRYGCEGWPTLVLIDPEGNIYKAGSGEGLYDALDKEIGKLAKIYKDKKMLEEKPLRFELARFTESGASPLFFPGKVLADEKNNRLFIADSTHHRIVITDLAGKKIAIAGNGNAGFKDGSFDDAEFSDPQGMALADDILYVADRRNHTIRGLDLKKSTVKTIAGTGEQNRWARAEGGPALKTGLNSPWDLLLHNNKLFIAMAGHHQIWTLDLAKNRVDPYAGSGREDIHDDDLMRSHFAQPSGLATDGKTLWVADSETSAIRAMPLAGEGDVTTVVGAGLFEFGDVEGEGGKVRLQHALGVAYKDGKLYVADTYNSKIKIIDPATKTCKTFAGERGGWLSASTFSEPGGLSFAGNKLYVADTNGHRI